MLGRFTDKNSPVAIVGGGAAGLFLAYSLVKRGRNVELYESSQRLGGMLNTTVHPRGLVECAANSLVATQALRDLCIDLGIELQSIEPASHSKYIVRGQKMWRNPLRIFELIRLVFGVLVVKAKQAEPSAAEFAVHHLGKAGLDYLFDPLVAGIYGASPHTINMAIAFPRLTPQIGQTLFQKFRVLKKQNQEAKREVVVVRGGMHNLVNGMERYLRSCGRCEIYLNTQPHKVDQLLENAQDLALTVPAIVAAKLLEKRDPQASAVLSRIKYTPMVSIGLFVKKSDLKRLPQGLGVLIPKAERHGVLGILFTSSTFPDRVNAHEDILLTCMLGGEQDGDAIYRSDTELITTCIVVIGTLFGWRSANPEVDAVVNRWERAIPQYDRLLKTNLEMLAQSYCKLPGRVLFGNYTGEVSLRGMLGSVVTSVLNQNEPG